jgi:hypothetical protein
MPRQNRAPRTQAGIGDALGCHTFRATGTTVYLLNGVLLDAWIRPFDVSPRQCLRDEFKHIRAAEVSDGDPPHGKPATQAADAWPTQRSEGAFIPRKALRWTPCRPAAIDRAMA